MSLGRRIISAATTSAAVQAEFGGGILPVVITGSGPGNGQDCISGARLGRCNGVTSRLADLIRGEL